MKKVICGIGVTLTVIGVIFFTCFNKKDERKIVIDKSSNKNNLSILLEETLGKNDFKQSAKSSWPGSNYVFNSRLSGCENGGTLSYKDGVVYMEGETSDKCYVYFNKSYVHWCYESFACSIAMQRELFEEESHLYFHDSTLENSAEDLSYRYAGSSDEVENYVCFGSDATPCPDENLYRIIGVFNIDGEYKVKLIKATYATEDMLGTDGDKAYYDFGDGFIMNSENYYYWSYKNETLTNDKTGYSNVWSYSYLNTVNLNTNYINYLNSIDTKWANMIAESTWVVGGVKTGFRTSTAKQLYENEIIHPDDSIEKEYKAKIGLVYASDTMYMASPEYWYLPSADDKPAYGVYNDYSLAKEHHWLTSTTDSSLLLTITRNSDISDYYIWFSLITGRLATISTVFEGSVRPTFYLNNNVEMASGAGTKTNPWRLTT